MTADCGVRKDGEAAGRAPSKTRTDLISFEIANSSTASICRLPARRAGESTSAVAEQLTRASMDAGPEEPEAAELE